MKFRWVGFCVLVLCAGESRAQSEGGKRPRAPNIVLVYTDDHAQWAVGAYGNGEVHTPHIDRLAAEGILFTRGFTKPVCSPSRAMLLTGLYGHRVGIPDFIPYGNPVRSDNGLPPGVPTIASVLKGGGYATGLIGKWHLGYGERYYPERFGFDHAEGYRYLAPGSAVDGVGDVPFLVEGNEISRFRNDPRHTDILVDGAIEFIQENKSRPFLLYLSLYRPHLPWNALLEEDLAPYEGAALTVPDPPADSSVDRTKLEELTRLYYANITCTDRNVGRVFAALDAEGLAEDTVVLFIGDNGFMVGQHGLLGKGNARVLHVDERGRISRDRGTRPNMYDDSILVPFVVRWPGVVAAGSTCDALVSTIDILPTVGEVAGVETPGGLDGRSLLPLLKGGAGAAAGWRDAYFDSYDMMYLGDGGEEPRMRMIRTADWKLVLYGDKNGRMPAAETRHALYHLARDPGEVTNLYDQPDAAGSQRRLTRRLEEWIREAGDEVAEERE